MGGEGGKKGGGTFWALTLTGIRSTRTYTPNGDNGHAYKQYITWWCVEATITPSVSESNSHKQTTTLTPK